MHNRHTHTHTGDSTKVCACVMRQSLIHLHLHLSPRTYLDQLLHLPLPGTQLQRHGLLFRLHARTHARTHAEVGEIPVNGQRSSREGQEKRHTNKP